MNSIFPDLLKRDQEIVDKIGLKPFVQEKINPFLSPNQPHYWAASGISMMLLQYFRMKMCITRGPKLFYSGLIVLIPIIGISDHRAMINNVHARANNSLKLKLLFEPELKKSFEESIRINDAYQNESVSYTHLTLPTKA